MAEIQVLLEKKEMHDSCLQFLPGVSNLDQGKCITLELYFTFELSADAKTKHLRLHLIGVIWLFLVIRYINKHVVLPFTN